MSETADIPDAEFLAITADLLRIFGRRGKLLVRVNGAIGYLHWLKDAPIEDVKP
jgi:hypothetical protein